LAKFSGFDLAEQMLSPIAEHAKTDAWTAFVGWRKVARMLCNFGQGKPFGRETGDSPTLS